MLYISQNQSDKVVEMVTFITDVVGNKYNSAVKDNDFIYHMAVPDISALDPTKSVNFVKPLPFNPTDSKIAGPDIFQKLVPMRAHESSSLYRYVSVSCSLLIVCIVLYAKI